MDKKILVAYATKYDATAEIAQRLGSVLQAQGLAVEVLPAEKAGDPAQYAAVVLGSAVYAGSWRKEAADYLQANQTALAQLPV